MLCSAGAGPGRKAGEVGWGKCGVCKCKNLGDWETKPERQVAN